MKNRTHEIKIRLSDEEFDRLNEMVSRTIFNREAFLRMLIQGAVIKEAPPADVPYLLRAMRQAGYNLDQLLKRVNSGNILDVPQFRKDIEELRAATRLVVEQYTSR